MAIAPLKSFLAEVSTPNSSAPHGRSGIPPTRSSPPATSLASAVPCRRRYPFWWSANPWNRTSSLRCKVKAFDPNNSSVGQMPASGTLFTTDQIDALAALIDAGCPE